MPQFEITEDCFSTLMWALGVARASASEDGMPTLATSIWMLTKDLIKQHEATRLIEEQTHKDQQIGQDNDRC